MNKKDLLLNAIEDMLNGNIDKIYPTIEKDLLERRKSKE